MSNSPRDLRKYTRQTNLRLLLGGIALLYLVGGGLIYFFYGPAALVSGLLCLTAGLLPMLLIWGFLSVMDWIVRKANQD